MKTIPFAALLFAFACFAVPVLANDIKEVDYPLHYEVVSAAKISKWGIEKICSMTLRDQAERNVIFNVSKKGYASCPVLEKGKIFNGRQNVKKNEIELVILVGEDRARVEGWHIDAIVNNAPRS